MISRRVFGEALGLLALAVLSPLPARAAAAPAVTLESFYDTLVGVMKDGPKLGFVGRRDRLAPALEKAFDLPLMTRLMVGPQWRDLDPAEQDKLVEAFSRFSIATYANRFDAYSGERFIVDPDAVPASNGDQIVHSRLVKSDGGTVELDYLMRQSDDAWQIIDVYLSGTVSELATRRSEFTSVLQRGGPAALVELLQRKAAELAG